MILLCRNMHDFMGAHGGPNTLEPLFSVMYKALKPGGVLVIEDHRGDPKRPQDPKAVSGYVREDFAIDHAMKTGFRFLARSDILANPKDTKDYPQGVFFLPPGERGAGGELSPADKARAEAIGESDRFLIKLEKPRP
jgi:predicted methyltransferase